jgi:sugar phosphate isomerase/epimerase
MGLENHWGLGRSAAGVIRVVEEVNSPWLKATLDTGNFLEEKYEQMESLASYCVLVQAKTYYGGGTWYTLNLDYQRIADILKGAGYKGWISLEFEGKKDVLSGIESSLKMLRSHF